MRTRKQQTQLLIKISLKLLPLSKYLPYLLASHSFQPSNRGAAVIQQYLFYFAVEVDDLFPRPPGPMGHYVLRHNHRARWFIVQFCVPDQDYCASIQLASGTYRQMLMM